MRLTCARWLPVDERTRDIGIIILTASVEDHEEGESTDAGVDAYLRKPCTGDALLAAVNAVLGRGAVASTGLR